MSTLCARSTGTGLIFCGALGTAWIGWQQTHAWLYQRHAAQAFETAAAAAPGAVTWPAGGTPGSPPVRLEILRVGIRAMVVQGDDAADLSRGIVHIAATAGVEEAGNIGLAAHRDTYFRNLRRIALGDTIALATPRLRRLYVVAWRRIVRPENVEVLQPTATSALTLVTCYPFHYVGHAPKRFVVRALALEPDLETAASAAVPAGRGHRQRSRRERSVPIATPGRTSVVPVSASRTESSSRNPAC